MEKEGDIISGKLRKESPEELTVVSATAAATEGRDKWELQQVLQQGNPAQLLPCFNPAPPCCKIKSSPQPATCPQQSAARDNGPFHL